MNLSIKLVVLRSKKRLVRVKESAGQGKRIEEQKPRDGVKNGKKKSWQDICAHIIEEWCLDEKT